MRLLLFLVISALVLGCASSSDGEPGDTIELRMDVVRFTPGMGDVPLEGVEVCVRDTDNCATSDGDGFVDLTLPANSEVTLTVLKDGYVPTLSPQLTTDADEDDRRTALIDEQTARLLAGVLGTPYPLSGGAIAISALEPPLRRADNGVAGIELSSADRTPYYLDEGSFPTFDIDATTEPDGVGGFVELPNGVYEIVVGSGAYDCEIASAWPGGTGDTIRVPAAHGFFTQAFLACEPDAS